MDEKKVIKLMNLGVQFNVLPQEIDLPKFRQYISDSSNANDFLNNLEKRYNNIRKEEQTELIPASKKDIEANMVRQQSQKLEHPFSTLMGDNIAARFADQVASPLTSSIAGAYKSINSPNKNEKASGAAQTIGAGFSAPFVKSVGLPFFAANEGIRAVKENISPMVNEAIKTASGGADLLKTSDLMQNVLGLLSSPAQTTGVVEKLGGNRQDTDLADKLYQLAVNTLGVKKIAKYGMKNNAQPSPKELFLGRKNFIDEKLNKEGAKELQRLLVPSKKQLQPKFNTEVQKVKEHNESIRRGELSGNEMKISLGGVKTEFADLVENRLPSLAKETKLVFPEKVVSRQDLPAIQQIGIHIQDAISREMAANENFIRKYSNNILKDKNNNPIIINKEKITLGDAYKTWKWLNQQQDLYGYHKQPTPQDMQMLEASRPNLARKIQDLKEVKDLVYGELDKLGIEGIRESRKRTADLISFKEILDDQLLPFYQERVMNTKTNVPINRRDIGKDVLGSWWKRFSNRDKSLAKEWNKYRRGDIPQINRPKQKVNNNNVDDTNNPNVTNVLSNYIQRIDRP